MGWVADDAGGYRGQMAVLVKPNGLFGKVYMAAIAPFRYLIVYPPLIRGIGQERQAGMLWAGVSPKSGKPQVASPSSVISPAMREDRRADRVHRDQQWQWSNHEQAQHRTRGRLDRRGLRRDSRRRGTAGAAARLGRHP